MHIITMWKKVTNKTYMWKLYKDENTYCFQSCDPRVKRKMARRKDFTIFNWAINHPQLVYISSKKTTQSAKRTLARLTGSEVHYLRSDDVYVAETNTIVTSKKRSEHKK